MNARRVVSWPLHAIFYPCSYNRLRLLVLSAAALATAMLASASGLDADRIDAAALLTVLGTDPPQRVVVSELTTVASVWTAAQFLDGAALSGNPPGLRIAAGNVPNLVDLEPAAWGV